MMASRSAMIAVIGIGAMLIGSGVTYFVMRSTSAPDPVVHLPPAESKAGTGGEPVVDDVELERAKDRARAARAAGSLSPVAVTADEFAVALGAINYRIEEFSVRFADPPGENVPERAAYERELAGLTDSLANLLLDEHLADHAVEDSPESLAHHQALLAGGSLGLDAATISKIEGILAKAYAAAFPAGASDELTPEQQRKLDENLAAMSESVAVEIAALLSPEQKARFDLMGAEQVLFGLSNPGE